MALCSPGRFHLVVAIYLASFLTIVHLYLGPYVISQEEQSGGVTAIADFRIRKDDDKETRRTIRLDLDIDQGKATLILQLTTSPNLTHNSTDLTTNTHIVAVGKHWANVLVDRKSCSYPRFWIRLIGDALVPLELVVIQESSGQQHEIWNGSFTIPFAGTYTVDSRWFGCEPGSIAGPAAWRPLPNKVLIRAVGRDVVQLQATRSKESHLFSNSVWISRDRIMKPSQLTMRTNVSLPDYIWTSFPPASETTTTTSPGGGGGGTQQDLIKLDHETLGLRSVIVSKSGTLTRSHGMYRFDDNGNYELVCFWGSHTMWKLWQIFLVERRIVSPGQRPFKFHYYNVTNMVHPDQNWTLNDKQRCRKCKHIFVSVDELDGPPLSQSEYQQQLTTFVNHLVQLLNNPTFPIWILSTIQPPMKAVTCHPQTLPRSTNHPCNDVMKHMFRPNHEIFPAQVHFMDNTDLVLPHQQQLGEESEYWDVLANIALRIFVAVGKGVADWRAMGQQGLIDGLHRNGTVEPNFELHPYEGWA